jgi:C1q domain
MTILLDGTLGITTPALVVNGNTTYSGTGIRFLADFSNATVTNRLAFQTSTTNSSTGIYALPNGTSTAASWQATNAADPTNASKILIATNGSTDVQLVSGINGTGTYLPLSFYTSGAEKMRLDTSGNLGIGVTPFVNTLSSGLDLKNGAGLFGYSNNSYLTNNLYYDSAWKYKGTGFGASIVGNSADGAIQFNGTSASGSAGGTATVTERMRIDSSGNVGIGTTSPVGKLQIDSNAGSTVTNTLTLNNNGGGGGNGAAINFYNNTALQPFTGRINSLDDGNYGFHMVFSTKPGGGSGSGALTERMRINSGGAITTSYNPAFFSIITGGAYTSGQTFGGSLTGTNPSTRSSYYSNGTFTAPVAGYYQFNFQVYDFNSNNASYAVFKNGSGYVPSDWFQMVGGNPMLAWSFVLYLNAGDYIQMGIRAGSISIYGGHSYWSGFLIG